MTQNTASIPPATSTESRAPLVVNASSVVVFFLVGMLMLNPTWPLAVGVVAACVTVGYVARLVMATHHADA